MRDTAVSCVSVPLQPLEPEAGNIRKRITNRFQRSGNLVRKRYC